MQVFTEKERESVILSSAHKLFFSLCDDDQSEDKEEDSLALLSESAKLFYKTHFSSL